MHWFGDALKKVYDIKMEVLGPRGPVAAAAASATAATEASAGDAGSNVEEIRVFNRVIRWTSEGIEFERDQRHVEIFAR